jgi:hypothetical protein
MDMREVISDDDIRSMIDAVTDNGGKTADRYAVFFGGGDVLGMSGAPTHPQGFSQWSEGHYDSEVKDDKQINFDELPEGIQAHVFTRMREGYRDFCKGRHAKGKSVADIHQEIMDCY